MGVLGGAVSGSPATAEPAGDGPSEQPAGEASRRPARPAVRPASDDLGRRLARHLSRRSNHREVLRAMLAWHKTTRNGCVAFASTALRALGVDVPERGVRDGLGISRITLAFSQHLEDTLGWTRIERATDLLPGDLVFTADAPCCPGFPDHVFVFLRWHGKRRQIAYVADNQGFSHRRRLNARPRRDGSPPEISPFAYALRPAAPAASDPGTAPAPTRR